MDAAIAMEELWGSFCPDCGPLDYDGIVAHIKARNDEARSHLRVALLQVAPSDDPIIVEHIRDALTALGGQR